MIIRDPRLGAALGVDWSGHASAYAETQVSEDDKAKLENYSKFYKAYTEGGVEGLAKFAAASACTAVTGGWTAPMCSYMVESLAPALKKAIPGIWDDRGRVAFQFGTALLTGGIPLPKAKGAYLWGKGVDQAAAQIHQTFYGIVESITANYTQKALEAGLKTSAHTDANEVRGVVEQKLRSCIWREGRPTSSYVETNGQMQLTDAPLMPFDVPFCLYLNSEDHYRRSISNADTVACYVPGAYDNTMFEYGYYPYVRWTGKWPKVPKPYIIEPIEGALYHEFVVHQLEPLIVCGHMVSADMGLRLQRAIDRPTVRVTAYLEEEEPKQDLAPHVASMARRIARSTEAQAKYYAKESRKQRIYVGVALVAVTAALLLMPKRKTRHG